MSNQFPVQNSQQHSLFKKDAVSYIEKCFRVKYYMKTYSRHTKYAIISPAANNHFEDSKSYSSFQISFTENRFFSNNIWIMVSCLPTPLWSSPHPLPCKFMSCLSLSNWNTNRDLNKAMMMMIIIIQKPTNQNRTKQTGKAEKPKKQIKTLRHAFAQRESQ